MAKDTATARVMRAIGEATAARDEGRPADGLPRLRAVEALVEDTHLELEVAVDQALKEAIACCEAEQDYQTRQVLLQLLSDTEEDHIWWLEKQLALIDKIGLPNYLQSKMGSDPVHG